MYHATKTAGDTASSYIATAFSSEAHRRLAPSDVPLHRYELARLSKVEDKDVWPFFDTYAGGLREILSVVPIGDGSYEIVMLDSHCDTLRSRLNEFLPSSKFELNYDPAQPTEADLATWEYEQAKAVRKEWFSQRAMRQTRESWSTAAAYYAYRLELLGGCDRPLTNLDCDFVTDKPSILTSGS